MSRKPSNLDRLNRLYELAESKMLGLLSASADVSTHTTSETHYKAELLKAARTYTRAMDAIAKVRLR